MPPADEGEGRLQMHRLPGSGQSPTGAGGRVGGAQRSTEAREEGKTQRSG